MVIKCRIYCAYMNVLSFTEVFFSTVAIANERHVEFDSAVCFVSSQN